VIKFKHVFYHCRFDAEVKTVRFRTPPFLPPFDVENQVHKSRWTLLKFLFYGCRFGPLLLFPIVIYGLVGDHDLESCKHLVPLMTFCLTLFVCHPVSSEPLASRKIWYNNLLALFAPVYIHITRLGVHGCQTSIVTHILAVSFRLYWCRRLGVLVSFACLWSGISAREVKLFEGIGPRIKSLLGELYFLLDCCLQVNSPLHSSVVEREIQYINQVAFDSDLDKVCWNGPWRGYWACNGSGQFQWNISGWLLPSSHMSCHSALLRVSLFSERNWKASCRAGWGQQVTLPDGWFIQCFKSTRPAILPNHDLDKHHISCTGDDRVCFHIGQLRISQFS